MSNIHFNGAQYNDTKLWYFINLDDIEKQKIKDIKERNYYEYSEINNRECYVIDNLDSEYSIEEKVIDDHYISDNYVYYIACVVNENIRYDILNFVFKINKEVYTSNLPDYVVEIICEKEEDYMLFWCHGLEDIVIFDLAYTTKFKKIYYTYDVDDKNLLVNGHRELFKECFIKNYCLNMIHYQVDNNIKDYPPHNTIAILYYDLKDKKIKLLFSIFHVMGSNDITEIDEGAFIMCLSKPIVISNEYDETLIHNNNYEINDIIEVNNNDYVLVKEYDDEYKYRLFKIDKISKLRLIPFLQHNKDDDESLKKLYESKNIEDVLTQDSDKISLLESYHILQETDDNMYIVDTFKVDDNTIVRVLERDINIDCYTIDDYNIMTIYILDNESFVCKFVYGTDYDEKYNLHTKYLILTEKNQNNSGGSVTVLDLQSNISTEYISVDRDSDLKYFTIINIWMSPYKDYFMIYGYIFNQIKTFIVCKLDNDTKTYDIINNSCATVSLHNPTNVTLTKNYHKGTIDMLIKQKKYEDKKFGIAIKNDEVVVE